LDRVSGYSALAMIVGMMPAGDDLRGDILWLSGIGRILALRVVATVHCSLYIDRLSNGLRGGP
jgi:hypothetical protein